jgi:hypothetical protein
MPRVNIKKDHHEGINKGREGTLRKILMYLIKRKRNENKRSSIKTSWKR